VSQENPFGPDGGPYANQSTQPPAPPSAGNSRWIWILLAVMFFFVLAATCCGGFALLGLRGVEAGLDVLKAPVDAAVVALNEDPEVTAKLGMPIESETGFGVNQFESNNGNGGAQVNFRVSGPNGSAQVNGRMRLTAGTWSAEDLTITCDDGTALKLP
jgi:hypothetical protein